MPSVPGAVRRFRTGWLTGGLHVLILWIALEAETKEVWPFALAAMAAVSFFAWQANYRRYRQVHDVPTSKVASAAQGYVELFGRSMPIAGSTLAAPISKQPCCWFRYCVERKDSKDKWTTEDSGESITHFLLVDDTGQCAISPDGAEILFPQYKCWTEGSRRYTEELLLPEGRLYALGEFSTATGAAMESESTEVSHLLADWKQDPAKLLERFDQDRSGELDLKEWERARLEARADVRRNRGKSPAHEGAHLMSKPADGRVFILAAEMPEKIGRRYQLWSWVHLSFFFAAGILSFLLFRAA